MVDFKGPRDIHGWYLEQVKIWSIFDDIQGTPRIEGTWSEEGNPVLWGPTKHQSYRHQTSNLSTVNY